MRNFERRLESVECAGGANLGGYVRIVRQHDEPESDALAKYEGENGPLIDGTNIIYLKIMPDPKIYPRVSSLK